MDLTELFTNLETKGFIVEKRGSFLPNGKYGVKIMGISLETTTPKEDSGKEPVDFVKFELEAVEPAGNAGQSTNISFFAWSGKEDKGPTKNMTYGFWSLYETSISLSQHGYFKLPKSSLTDSDKFIEALTGKANEFLTDKVFYVERKNGKNSQYANTNFLSLDKEEAGELGAYPDETQEAAEKIASESTFSDNENPFGREAKDDITGTNTASDDDWI